MHWMITGCCACVGIRNNNKFSQFITYLQVVPTEINFIHLKTYIKNGKTKQPITPSFVLYIEYTLDYTFIHFGMSMSCKQGSLLISK